MRSSSERKLRGYGYDFSLLFVVIFLCVFGLIMVYSSSYYTAELSKKNGTYYLERQVIFDLLGFGMILILSLLPWKGRRLDNLFSLGGIAAYVLAMFSLVLITFFPSRFGVSSHGQTRWMKITGTLSFQPSEIAKLALILVMAMLLVKARKSIDDNKVLGKVLLPAALPVLLVLQTNLSSAIILIAIALFMCFIVSTNYKRTAIVIGIGLAGLFVAVFFTDVLLKIGLKEYQLSRILVWKDPAAYSSSGGYQVLQGLYAIGSGGLFGKGLGNSTQKLGFIPEASNDMIFAIICEELGLFGGLCLILLYVFMLYRLLMIATHAGSLFRSLTVAGIFVHLGLQIIMHIAVVTNAMPNTGVSLPFISYGGTSSVFLLFEIGLALRISRETGEEDV